MKNEDTRKQILQMKQSGKTYAEIGKALGFSRQRAQKIVARNWWRSGICPICNRDTDLEEHHISYVPEVIETICASCHKRKHPLLSSFKEKATALRGDFEIDTAAYAKKLGCCLETAGKIARDLGIKLVARGARPTRHFNWDLPNKILAEIWFGGVSASKLTHVAKLRSKVGRKQSPYGGVWIRNTEPKHYPVEFSDAVNNERIKSRQWNSERFLER